jgi:hypothetical protein
MVQPEDLQKPSGTPIRSARVENGQVMDIAWLKMDKINDFQVVYQTAQAKHQSLAAAMLIESAVQPKKERVTAAQINRIRDELDGALGGVYAPISDMQQGPLVRRLVHQLEKNNILPTLDKKVAKTNILTGIAALAKAADADKLLALIQVAAQLPPQVQAKINYAAAFDAYVRYTGIDEPGIIKSDEQVAAEMQQAMAAQAMQEAASKAIDTTGNIVEAQATAQPQGAPQ